MRALAAVTGTRAAGRYRPLPAPAPPITGTGYFATRRAAGRGGRPFPAAREVRDEAELPRRGSAGRDRSRSRPSVCCTSRTPAGWCWAARRGRVAAAFRELHGAAGRLPYAVEELADLSDGVELIVGVNRTTRGSARSPWSASAACTPRCCADVAFALAPVTAERPSAAALRGWRRCSRGARQPAGRRRRRGRVVAAADRGGAAHPEIAEIEVNPLLVPPPGRSRWTPAASLPVPENEN